MDQATEPFHGRDLRAPPWIWIGAALLIAFPLLTLVPGFPFGTGEALIATCHAGRLVLEAAACLWAAQRSELPRRLRQSLRLFGAASVLSACNNLLSPTIAMGLWSESFGQALFLVSFLLALVVLFLFPRLPLRRGQAWTVAADLVISVGTQGLLSWLFVTYPASAVGGEQGRFAVVLGVSQLAMLAGLNLVIVLGQAVPSRRAFWWFVAGQAMYLPSLYLPQLQHPAAAFISEATWFVGVIPTMVAAARFRHDPISGVALRGSPRWMLNFNPLALASPLVLGAFLYGALTGGRAERVMPLGAALLGTSLLLVARVVLSAKEIARLQKEERAAAERLQRAKMEAIGLLAGGIAHEFNNLMATVISTASLGAEEAEPGGPAREDFGTIRLAGERAAGLTRQLLHFAGRQPDLRRPLDVGEAFVKMQDRLHAAAGPRTRLELSIEAAPRAHADPVQVETALVHLARNAGQAMPDGGTLRISVSGQDLDSPQLGAVLSAPPGRYVALKVSDTGAGMSPDVLARIFEPFFSTRSIFESKGLGLAEVHGIVAAHAGGLAVESAPGKGASFLLLLPAAADQLPPALPDRSRGGQA